MQWGTIYGSYSTFPIPFPHKCFGITAGTLTGTDGRVQDTNCWIGVSAYDNYSVTIYRDCADGFMGHI